MARRNLQQSFINIKSKPSAIELFLDADSICSQLEATIKSICNQLFKEKIDAEIIGEVSDILIRINHQKANLNYYKNRVEDISAYRPIAMTK